MAARRMIEIRLSRQERLRLTSCLLSSFRPAEHVPYTMAIEVQQPEGLNRNRSCGRWWPEAEDGIEAQF